MTIDESIKILDEMIPIGEYENKKREAIEFAITTINVFNGNKENEKVGTWTHTATSTDWFTDCLKCSLCGYEDEGGNCFPYCPNCGVKMNGE